jgi:hypothetical protein
MPTLHRLMISKTRLDALRERERSILLGGGKILNELNIGTKHLKFSANAVLASRDGPARSVAFSTPSFFLRMLAGHVLEAHRFLQKNFRVKESQRSKSNHFDDSFLADLKRLFHTPRSSNSPNMASPSDRKITPGARFLEAAGLVTLR